MLAASPRSARPTSSPASASATEATCAAELPVPARYPERRGIGRRHVPAHLAYPRAPGDERAQELTLLEAQLRDPAGAVEHEPQAPVREAAVHEVRPGGGRHAS